MPKITIRNEDRSQTKEVDVHKNARINEVLRAAGYDTKEYTLSWDIDRARHILIYKRAQMLFRSGDKLIAKSLIGLDKTQRKDLQYE